MSIVVFGSINVDLVARTPHLPAPGETIQGTTFNTTPGGKGANQAVACARLGTPTRLVGRVGTDSFGDELLANLQANRVNTDGVQRATNTSSGVAVIAVDDHAENTIIVIPGANGAIDQSDLAHLETALEGAGALLMQLEIGLDHVRAAAQMAQARNIPVILDPAPARPLPASLYPLIDIITPNETEAAFLVGFDIGNEAEAARAA